MNCRPSTFEQDATFPAWIYNGLPIADPFGHGERAVRFLRALKHPKSRAPKRAFQLDDWQERIVRRIYGPRHDDGTRIIKTVFLLLPRGNRKTSLAAALALLHTIGPEKLPGGEVISAASDQKQARIGFDEAANIIRCDNRFGRKLKIVDHRNRISYPAEGTFYEAISSDAGTQHGRTPVFILADELHAWKKRDLWDVLRSGLPKTKGALVVIATTAGRGQDNVAHELYDYARKVARGDIEDPAFLPILFEAPRDCDWRDEAIWRYVNPGLAHGYPDIDGLRQLAREAENRPGDREAFRQLHLNIWLDHSTDPFVDMAVYDQGNVPIDIDALRGRPCWLAVDLSSTTDLTAIVAAWRDDDGGYIVQPWFFCPGDNLRRRAEIDGVPYPLWREGGFISATPGNVVDYDYVEQRIRELCDEFDVQEIAFDPHLARQTITRLLADGLPAVEMRQGWVTMAPAIRELERAIIAGKFQHGGHPVLRWNFSNIAVETDKAGNQTFHKGKSTDRIDGAQATAMAVGRAFVGESNVSAYNAPESTGLFIFH
ncbi:MAG: terminase large subunit [Mesorhizobium sp.]|uniref:terminase large subunit n=1 Tax=Mesorhizobium sp. TaxID=1871066 RepID=UPI000FE5655B|nr:terminase TerL endonuclease subunit [Mesorhizobium sp.]RWB08990.1 MAG: terminase large subunit [Mesorhizobium sp.]RWB17411.1 MAG: terminase large subunit [Mesorhizobium sp.]